MQPTENILLSNYNLLTLLRMSLWVKLKHNKNLRHVRVENGNEKRWGNNGMNELFLFLGLCNVERRLWIETDILSFKIET